MSKSSSGVEYSKVAEIKGPLLVIDGVSRAAFDELVEIEDSGGKRRLARVLETGFGKAVVQVFEGTSGLSISGTKSRFLGHTMQLPVSDQLLGRVFDGLGKPLDGLPEPVPKTFLDVNGAPINPERRAYPTDLIRTGVSVIDGMLTLVRGQKLPIFSGAGMPHNMLAAQVARQATVTGESEEFAVVFAAVGVSSSDARFFQRTLTESGAIRRSILYLNLADDPAIERIITPRVALTAAEYLAFELNMHVLVIITDITNYCEALREISAAREEVPGRKGFPGYLYTDLAMIYERAGRIKGMKGSITQMPILSMPNDDVTHPIPDLTGYITEGQIFLGRELFRKGLYPPVYVLSSLSRLMGPALGQVIKRGKAPADQYQVGNQLYNAYARSVELRALGEIVGKSGLTDSDLKYLAFGDAFEQKYLNQGSDENRSFGDTLKIAWEVLSILPKSELTNVKEEFIQKYYVTNRSTG
ncbi:MAG: V-type ATP synthase subunit B [Nitrososphaerales archaeon]